MIGAKYHSQYLREYGSINSAPASPVSCPSAKLTNHHIANFRLNLEGEWRCKLQHAGDIILLQHDSVLNFDGLTINYLETFNSGMKLLEKSMRFKCLN